MISMFGQNTSQEIDVNNIKIFLICIFDFISNKKLKNNREEDILFLKDFGQIAFDFVSSVFKGRWNQLKMKKNNKMFHKLIKNKFITKVPTPNKRKKINNSSSIKLVNFLKLPPLKLLLRTSKKVLEKSKFHEKNTSGKNKKVKVTTKLSRSRKLDLVYFIFIFIFILFSIYFPIFYF